jgi:kynurenine formamidase
MVEDLTDDELAAMFDRCSNTDRWGADDERGTLNYITQEASLNAARLVTTGECVSLSFELSTVGSAHNVNPVQHIMTYQTHEPNAALDYIGITPHGFSVTHLDAVAHMYWRGRVYNGRFAADVVLNDGLAFGGISAAEQGLATRGVLLDVAATRGVDWLEADAYVTVQDLEAAERLAGLTVRSGDAVFVHVGLAARERQQQCQPMPRAGIHAECIPWIHDREVSIWSGDCVERIPYPSRAFDLPLHQIGLPAMGLSMLDWPDVEPLVEACARHRRNEFFVLIAPLRLGRATGSPVNPIAIF